ncbi:MAG: lysophospholipid acyltransferase family protein, partial [Myxococcota bacterium]|nr:lysophospholipid acyltransferase family protein [Myxococcota bacterium]
NKSMFSFSKVRGFAATTLGFIVLGITGIPYCILLLFLLPVRSVRIKLGNYYGHAVGPILIALTGTKMHVKNKERLDPTRPAIYITNHSSNLDPLIAISICPIGGCGISKKQLVYTPFFGLVYLLSGHLLIDRSNRSKAIKSMNRIADIVQKHNLSLWIWPEGTRSRDGRLLPFKKGFVHLALATKLPIVPIITHDGHKRWPARKLDIHPGKLPVEVLSPIDTSAWTLETLDEHLRMVQDICNEALSPEQRLLPVES